MPSPGSPSHSASRRSICLITASGRRSEVMTKYQAVEARFRRLGALQGAAGRLGKTPYGALIGREGPGLTNAEIGRLFEDLGGAPASLIDRGLAREEAAPAPPGPPGAFPVEKQRAIAMRLMARLGFDFE